jgi:hypothetical protein
MPAPILLTGVSQWNSLGHEEEPNECHREGERECVSKRFDLNHSLTPLAQQHPNARHCGSSKNRADDKAKAVNYWTEERVR